MIKKDCKNLESESNFSCRIYRGACDCEIDCPNYGKEKMKLNKKTIDRNINIELAKAKCKHPDFPKDIVHMVAIMAEESGEATRASLQYHYEGGTLLELKTELYQTAAMCIRVLENI